MAGRASNSKVVSKSAQSRGIPKEGTRADLAIDFDRYIPTVLSSLVAKLRANANVFFSQSYGVSLAEWRILSFLGQYGPASAYDIWTKASLDKAVVSRESSALFDKGLVKIAPVKGSARNRTEISLSDAGVALLDRSFDEVLRRHDNLTAGLDSKSIETFLRVVDHLEHRIAHMADKNMGDKSALSYSTHAPVKRIDRAGGDDQS
jgi:DNA-binding MarR family transcriptional regulator